MPLVESFEAWAMQLLTRAQKEGYFDTPEQQRMLDTDNDLTELRRRPEFGGDAVGLLVRFWAG